MVAEANSLAALDFAVRKGADWQAVDVQGTTALIAACKTVFGDPAEVVRRLLELGAEPKRANCEGQSALHMAVERGHVEAAKVLIDAGESLYTRYPLYIEGKSVEETRKFMRKGLREFEKFEQELDESFQELDQEGESLLGNLTELSANLIEKAVREQEEGWMGKSVADTRNHWNAEAVARILPELEAYEREGRR